MNINIRQEILFHANAIEGLLARAEATKRLGYLDRLRTAIRSRLQHIWAICQQQRVSLEYFCQKLETNKEDFEQATRSYKRTDTLLQFVKEKLPLLRCLAIELQ